MQLELPAFRPHPLVRGGHVQTLAGVFWPGKLRDEQAARRRVRLDDGDEIVLHDDRPPAWRPGDRTTLLVHGLGGCHRSAYMVRVAAKLNHAGVRTFRMDLRGCGAGEGLARLPYHAGRCDDVLAALRAIVQRCPEAPVCLVGFSLGGNLVLKLLGESPDVLPRHLERALAVNPPIDLAAATQALNGPLTRRYDRHLVGLLWRQSFRRREMLPEAPVPNSAGLPRSLREFDDCFTAPVSGFDSVDHYYATCSSSQFLPQVTIPTLILTARDDPLIPVSMFQDLACSSAIALHIADGGGHLGYLGRRGTDPDRRWMDWRVVAWVTAS